MGTSNRAVEPTKPKTSTLKALAENGREVDVRFTRHGEFQAALKKYKNHYKKEMYPDDFDIQDWSKLANLARKL